VNVPVLLDRYKKASYRDSWRSEGVTFDRKLSDTHNIHLNVVQPWARHWRRLKQRFNLLKVLPSSRSGIRTSCRGCRPAWLIAEGQSSATGANEESNREEPFIARVFLQLLFEKVAVQKRAVNVNVAEECIYECREYSWWRQCGVKLSWFMLQ